MVFLPERVPDQSLDSDANYTADVPFSLKQATISHGRHRWFEPIQISTPTSALYTSSYGLNAGALQRVQFDHKPDFIIVAVSGDTAATGRVRVYPGDEGGPFILLGPNGKIVMPSPQNGIVSLRNVGSTPTFGVIIAVAGYAEPGIDIFPGG